MVQLVSIEKDQEFLILSKKELYVIYALTGSANSVGKLGEVSVSLFKAIEGRFNHLDFIPCIENTIKWQDGNTFPKELD